MRIDISNRIGTTSNFGGFRGLLDKFSGAAAAYSLRKLSKATTSVVRVRRDSDNAEADFTALEITDGTLAAFCTGTDGLVTTWYDQSGNGNDATQGSASAQPKIVSAGVLVTDNGKPAVDFDGVDDNIATSFSVLVQPNTIFSVASTTDLLSLRLLYDDDDGSDRNTLSVEFVGPGNVAAFAGSALLGATWLASIPTMHTVLYNSTLSLIHRNGTQIASGNVGTQGLSGFTIGSRFSGNYWQGNIQEIAVYNSDQSTNRSGIEANINNYYNIY